QAGKSIADEEGVFLFAQGGQRIEPLQFGVDESRMAHHHAAVRQAFEKARKHCREVRAAMKRIGACKRRIGANAKRRSAPAEAAAQEIDQHSLAITKIAHPGRTQASGASRLAIASTASRTCGNSWTCWCPSMKSGARPKYSTKARTWRATSVASASALRLRRTARTSKDSSDTNAPSRNGANPA